MSKNIKKLLSGQMTLTKGDLSFAVDSSFIIQNQIYDFDE